MKRLLHRSAAEDPDWNLELTIFKQKMMTLQNSNIFYCQDMLETKAWPVEEPPLKTGIVSCHIQKTFLKVLSF